MFAIYVVSLSTPRQSKHLITYTVEYIPLITWECTVLTSGFVFCTSMCTSRFRYHNTVVVHGYGYPLTVYALTTFYWKWASNSSTCALLWYCLYSPPNNHHERWLWTGLYSSFWVYTTCVHIRVKHQIARMSGVGF